MTILVHFKAVLRPLSFLLFFCTGYASAAAPDQAGTGVADLLGGMSVALRTQSYEGTFTYEHSGALETFRVAHVVKDGEEFERLHYLSGPDREVVREARASGCLGVTDLILRGQLGNLFKQYPGLGEYYDVFIRGEDRVAGRDVVVVHVAPKDEYRFGQSLSLDKESLLPLRVLTLNKMQVLERFQFVEINVGDGVSSSAAEATAEKAVPIDKGLTCDSTVTPKKTLWQFGWVPKGFAMTGVRDTSRMGEMMMFTDGISSFSVFVDVVEESQGLEALRGATVVYMAPVQGGNDTFRVTLVGEVPLLTAKRVVAAMGLEHSEVIGDDSAGPTN